MKPPNAGKGRRKGVPNKMTRDLREMIMAALDTAGGSNWLAEQARLNPVAFMSLLGKLVPHAFTADAEAATPFTIVISETDARL